MVGGVDDINRSLTLLLSTRLGERVMQPTYGCALDEMQFKSLTTTLKTYVKDLIQTAILYFEPRIDIMDIQFTEQHNDGSIVIISIEYKIRSTNSRHNLVYPYYKTEGSGPQVS